MLDGLKKLPNFSLYDQNGRLRTQNDFLGNWLVVYFYPKDETPGCTKEACSFRDAWSDFADRKVSVVGVSQDSVQSHKKFAEKYGLPFVLLSDPDAKFIKACGAWGTKKFIGLEYEGILRNTYIVNPDGFVVKAFENITPADHADLISSEITTNI